MNPTCWWAVHRILHSYCYEDLQNPAGAHAMVGQLSGALGVPLSYEQHVNAANWVMEQRIDPAHPMHQARMWQMVRG
jgi:hypothetical protein